MRVIGLVPARGGSKGIPRKNIRLLCGKPLLQYTAEAALQTCSLTRVILSTEDEEIAEVGRRCGLDVPFLRPSELAKDETPMLSVVQHAIKWLEEQGDLFDAICLLQPSNPLRRSQDIDACIRLLQERDCDSVVTVLPVPAKYNPHWTYLQDSDGRLRISTGESEPITRRQDLPPALHREGSVYVTKLSVLREQNTLYGSYIVGYPVHASRSVNIDSPEDWALAERILTESSTIS
jgi:CMP-N-acetylneuraminic acid synthetase